VGINGSCCSLDFCGDDGGGGSGGGYLYGAGILTPVPVYYGFLAVVMIGFVAFMLVVLLLPAEGMEANQIEEALQLRYHITTPSSHHLYQHHFGEHCLQVGADCLQKY